MESGETWGKIGLLKTQRIHGSKSTKHHQTNCRGESASSNTYGDGAPSRFGGERRLRKERIEATHTHNDFTQLRAALVRKTLLLLVWLIWVLARERAVLQYTRAAGEVERKDWSLPS